MPKLIHQRSSNHAIGIASSELAVPLVSAGQHATIVGDIESIARGEELDMPWRRVRKLLDLGLAEILYPAMTAGSRRTLSLTDAGLAFFHRPLPPDSEFRQYRTDTDGPISRIQLRDGDH